MVASGLQTVIAGSLSCSTAGFRPSFRFLPSSAPRRSSAGTVGLSLLLALEVTIFGRPAADRGGAPRVDQADEHGEPSVGARRASTANFSSSGLRSRNHRRIHGQATRAARPGMAHLPTQSCSRYCRHGLLRRPTIGFDLLYAFIVVRLDRRDLVWINVTTNPLRCRVGCDVDPYEISVERHDASWSERSLGCLSGYELAALCLLEFHLH
jgi:hypothetical protein